MWDTNRKIFSKKKKTTNIWERKKCKEAIRNSNKQKENQQNSCYLSGTGHSYY